MAEENVTQDAQAITAFRLELLAGNFDEAKVIERDNAIAQQGIMSVVHSVYEEFLKEEEFINAIEIGNKYELPEDKIHDAIYLEFRRIIATGNIDSAIDWALQNNLPDYEITRAAIKGIEIAILNKNIEMAVDIKKKYSVNEEQIGNTWQIGYDDAFKNEKFFDAALLSREFGMSERKTIITAAKAFRKAIKQNDFDRMVLVESEFRIFNDNGFGLLGEEEGRTLIKLTESFIKEKLRSDSFRNIVEVIHGVGVLYKDIANHTLKDLVHFIYNQAVQIHEYLLQKNRYDDAVWFKNELSLLEENTPDKTLKEIYNQAVSFHNQYLQNGNFSLAIQMKQDYDLLGTYSDADSIDLIQSMIVSMLVKLIEKGDTNAGKELIKEYSIPQKEIENVANDAVINSLQDGKSERALEIVSKFHVDIGNFEVIAAAKEAFSQCRNNGYQETAANIGFIFEISSPEVKESAKMVWEDLISRNEYKKAAVIKKKHKLTKKYTDRIAKEEYNRLFQENKVEMAKKLREEYNLNVGLITWILEFIRKLLSLLFGNEEGPVVPPPVDTESENPLPESPAPETTKADV